MSTACCAVPRRSGRARRWFGAGGSIGPGVLLILLPKCPACVAAYVAVWTGAGIAAPIAGSLRWVLAGMFVVSVGFVVGSWVAGRRRRPVAG